MEEKIKLKFLFYPLKEGLYEIPKPFISYLNYEEFLTDYIINYQ